MFPINMLTWETTRKPFCILDTFPVMLYFSYSVTKATNALIFFTFNYGLAVFSQGTEKAKANGFLEITKPVNEDFEEPVFLTPII